MKLGIWIFFNVMLPAICGAGLVILCLTLKVNGL
ncbi:Uncharacterised protein [Yersinia mollaretii]|uniref:Uncharacterized protein n=1 Tax=Yersinia mollaretii TaxID=33060 RepID=A0AA36PGR3_YERMO|nr:Uncharacterised protein [Yersinia mollaretii]